jgi:hypothetical protein
MKKCLIFCYYLVLFPFYFVYVMAYVAIGTLVGYWMAAWKLISAGSLVTPRAMKPKTDSLPPDKVEAGGETYGKRTT